MTKSSAKRYTVVAYDSVRQVGRRYYLWAKSAEHAKERVFDTTGHGVSAVHDGWLERDKQQYEV